MGLPKRGKKSGNSDATWRKVGAIWTDKKDEDRIYISADDYHGELFFLDKESEKYYKVNFLSCFEPKKAKGAKKDLPKNLQYNISVNLANPDAAEEQETE